MRQVLNLILLSLILFVSLSNAVAEEVARVYSMRGSVEGLFSDGKDWVPVKVGTTFKAGDAIRVDKHGRAGVLFVDGMLVRLSNSATIRFKPVSKTKYTVKVDEGKAHLFSRTSATHPDVETPIVSAAIRGTEFVVDVQNNATTIKVIDGAVEASNEKGSSLARSGQLISAVQGQAPKTEVLVKPFEAVQWAVNYPYILSASDLKSGLIQESKLADSLRKSFQAASQGDYSAAWQHADKLASATGDASKLHLANMYLVSGNVDSAKKSLGSVSDSNGAASALKALIALLNNDNLAASQAYSEAVSVDSQSVAAALAGSYLYQNQQDLSQATSVIKDALKRHSENTSLKLRLAELLLSQADVDAAKAKLEAIDSKDMNGMYFVLRGLIALMEDERSQAESYFAKARSHDSEFPLAYFGSGLSAAANGNMEQSRTYFEQAVHMAPTNSLYRSYLGKAMFEMDDEERADEEYELAIALDENDPTPYLYRAFSKVSQNELVAALRDVESSIERNDNRAVYRSRQLLDQDTGTRSAGLSKVFTELGFNQAARVEAIKSLQADYSNYSAHRLLAESYDNATLLDSRLSEFRIAALLAPLSFNLFNSIGSETSFQNYDALFDKDENRTAFSFDGATKDDFLQGQALHAGKTEKTGYFMSYLANMRNGSKDNDFSRVHQIAGAGQYQVTPDLRIIADGSYQYLSQDFGDDEFAPDSQTDSYDAALGANLDLGKGKTLLAQVTYEHNSEVDRDFYEAPGIVEIFSPLEDESEVQGHVFLFDSNELERVRLFRSSVQYLQTTDAVTAVLGGQFFRAWTTRSDDAEILADAYEVADLDGNVVGEGFIFDGLGRQFPSKAKNDLTAFDVYSYATVHLTSWLDATVGGSVVDVERDYTDTSPYAGGTVSDKRFNPKAGLNFYLDPSVTVRTAYFEGLRKSVLLDQVSLEPSMVAGINQRFNDFALTKARNYGLGIDYKIPARTYIGIEGIRRYAREDRSDSSPVFLFDFDSLEEEQDVFVDSYDSFYDQDFVNAYWYQVLCGELVSGVEYNYGSVDLTDPAIDQQVSTHRTKLGLSYIGSYGLTSSVFSTWRQQSRDGFSDIASHEDFWVTDVVFRYRFPDRHGSVALSFLNIFDEEFLYEQSYVPIEGFVDTDFTVALGVNYNF